MTTRRAFIAGLLAAPLVVRTPGLLMPVRPVVWDTKWVLRDGSLFMPDTRKPGDIIPPQGKYANGEYWVATPGPVVVIGSADL